MTNTNLLFLDAVINQDYNYIEILLSQGANINYQYNPTDFNNTEDDPCDPGDTAFIISVRKEDLKMMEFLVQKNANINLINDQNYNSLTFSLEQSCLECVRFLIQNGVNVNSNTVIPSLISAVKSSSKEIVSLLIENGADINARDHEGNTPLILSVSVRAIYITALLLDKGADINAKTYQFNGTALSIAQLFNRIELVALLLTYGAHIRENDKRWNTSAADKIIQNTTRLNTMITEELDSLFEVDAFLWTSISKHYSKNAFNYFLDKYSLILNLPIDVVRQMF